MTLRRSSHNCKANSQYKNPYKIQKFKNWWVGKGWAQKTKKIWIVFDEALRVAEISRRGHYIWYWCYPWTFQKRLSLYERYSWHRNAECVKRENLDYSMKTPVFGPKRPLQSWISRNRTIRIQVPGVYSIKRSLHLRAKGNFERNFSKFIL